jgi:hypothetical protein
MRGIQYAQLSDSITKASEYWIGQTGIARHSLRNNFNGFLRALPVGKSVSPVIVKRPARPTHSPAVIVRESGRSSTPRLFDSIAGACDYWMPAFAGMMKRERSDCCAIFL